MTLDDPLRDLIIGYAPRDARGALAALLALDAALGQVLRTTREPMVGQMRLAWWREALARLDTAPPPAEPVLAALAADVLPRGVTGVELAAMVDGWEPLLGAIDDAAIAAHGEQRGAALFATAGHLLDVELDALADAGRGWALADLALHLRDEALATTIKQRTTPLLETAARRRWPRAARPLGTLVHQARMALAGGMTPTRVLRLGWHRLTGR